MHQKYNALKFHTICEYKHNVASPWCLWVAWAVRLVGHFSLNLSYSAIRKKAFVLSRTYRLGYT